MVGNVQKKFRVGLWRPFGILEASLKNNLQIPMLLVLNVMLKFEKIDQTIFFEFYRHTKKLGLIRDGHFEFQ